jgi:3-dehydroquinate synthase
MVVEARLAALLDLCPTDLAPRVRALLAHLGLPTSVPVNLSDAAIIAATAVDKKKRAGTVRYALPAGLGRMHPGDGHWSLPVGDAAVAKALAASRAGT